MEQQMKICRECKIEKEDDKFRHNTRVCKQCRNKKYNKHFNEKNKSFFQNYYLSNRDDILQKAKDRYYRNKEVEQLL